jgi:hypothetical protein
MARTGSQPAGPRPGGSVLLIRAEGKAPPVELRVPGNALDMQLPGEFVVRREIQAIQHFGQSMLERIPLGEVILADRPPRIHG